MLKAIAQRKVRRISANAQCFRSAHVNVGQPGMLHEQMSLCDIPEQTPEMARYCGRKRFESNGQVYPAKLEAVPLSMANNLEISFRGAAFSVGSSLLRWGIILCDFPRSADPQRLGRYSSLRPIGACSRYAHVPPAALSPADANFLAEANRSSLADAMSLLPLLPPSMSPSGL